MSILPLPQSLLCFWLLKRSLLLRNSRSIHLRISSGRHPVRSCRSMLSLPYCKLPGAGSVWGAFLSPSQCSSGALHIMRERSLKTAFSAKHRRPQIHHHLRRACQDLLKGGGSSLKRLSFVVLGLRIYMRKS